MATFKSLTHVGRIKHQVTRTDVTGTLSATGEYIKLAQDYPLVQSADLTDTFVDDNTLDEPANVVVAVSDLSYNIGDQIFARVDDGELTRLLIYDEAQSNSEQAQAMLFMGTGETAVDSEGDLAVDSEGDLAVAPKAEYY